MTFREPHVTHFGPNMISFEGYTITDHLFSSTDCHVCHRFADMKLIHQISQTSSCGGSNLMLQSQKTSANKSRLEFKV